MEAAEDGSAGDLRHFGELEGERAGVLAGRGVEQAEGVAIGEQAEADAGFAQQALEASGGRGVPAAGVFGDGGIEVLAGREFVDEQAEGGLGAVEIADGPGGAEGFLILGEDDGKGVRLVVGRDEGFGGPAEEVLQEGGEVAEGGIGGFVPGLFIPEVVEEVLVERAGVAVEEQAGVHKRGGRDDKAVRLEVAEPGEVVVEVGGHGSEIESGNLFRILGLVRR